MIFSILRNFTKLLFSIVIYFFALAFNVYAQKAVVVRDTITQHIFAYNEIESFEDKSGKLTFVQVSDPSFAPQFTPGKIYAPKITDLNTNYWYRIKIRHDQATKNNWLLEFFDQTIDDIEVYSPGTDNRYTTSYLGSSHPFLQRLYQ